MDLSRREFSKFGCRVIIGAAAGTAIIESFATMARAQEESSNKEYDWNDHLWGYVVDTRKCIGCRYCIQGCPYGARYFNIEKGTADKCTWCYHRITKGLLPACVQACPVGARKFGDLKDEESEINKILDKERINVLKADLGTKPKVYYVGLDREVR
jgi:ferredoxin